MVTGVGVLYISAPVFFLSVFFLSEYSIIL